MANRAALYASSCNQGHAVIPLIPAHDVYLTARPQVCAELTARPIYQGAFTPNAARPTLRSFLGTQIHQPALTSTVSELSSTNVTCFSIGASGRGYREE
jgi:hypothetical protein